MQEQSAGSETSLRARVAAWINGHVAHMEELRKVEAKSQNKKYKPLSDKQLAAHIGIKRADFVAQRNAKALPSDDDIPRYALAFDDETIFDLMRRMPPSLQTLIERYRLLKAIDPEAAAIWLAALKDDLHKRGGRVVSFAYARLSS